MTDDFWQSLALVGFAGFGLGIGLVIGAFVARALRLYMRNELGNGNGKRGRRHDDP